MRAALSSQLLNRRKGGVSRGDMLISYSSPLFCHSTAACVHWWTEQKEKLSVIASLVSPLWQVLLRLYPPLPPPPIATPLPAHVRTPMNAGMILADCQTCSHRQPFSVDHPLCQSTNWLLLASSYPIIKIQKKNTNHSKNIIFNSAPVKSPISFKNIIQIK